MNMELAVSITISIFIFIEILTVCYGCICCLPDKNGNLMEQPDEVLPLWLKNWGGHDYGLEFAADANIEEDDNLSDYDAYSQNKAGEVALNIIKDRVNTYFNKHKIFQIAKLDPIQYDYDNKKMLLILKNLKFHNLEAYDQNDAHYKQKARNQYGNYIPSPEVLRQISKKSGFKERIFEKEENGSSYLRRKDVVWRITLGAKLFPPTKSSLDDVPVVLETDFQIQPRNQAYKNALRARGVVTIHLYKFSFELEFVIKHIEDALRDYFNEEKRANNRVPDFDVRYEMSEMEIGDIKFEENNKDDNIHELPLDQDDDVNNNVPKKARSFKKTNPPKKVFIPVEDSLKKGVREHLNVVLEQIMKQRDNIRQRLCVNLMPKFAWKVLTMETKLQLPNIVLDVLQYEENFHPKVKIPAISLSWSERMAVGWDYMTSEFGAAGFLANGFSGIGRMLSRKKSNSDDDSIKGNNVSPKANKNAIKLSERNSSPKNIN